MAKKPEYQIEEMLGSYTVDGRVFLSSDENRKTLEQLQEEFHRKWDDNLISTIPLLKESETQKQLLDSGKLYQRPHTEIYSLTVITGTYRERRVRPDGKRSMTFDELDRSHISFLHEAKLAGLHIEAIVAHDISKPWYRRALRQEPRKTDYTFVVTTSPRSAPKQ